ncbi:MAG: hypothetical protein AAF969_03340 [Bacteroidota bacterium]
MTRYFSLKGLIPIWIMFFFLSCETESIQADADMEVFDPIQLTDQELIQKNFNLDSFDDSIGITPSNLNVIWNDFEAINLEGRVWFEYQVDELIKPDLEEGNITNINYTLLVTLFNQKPSYWIIKMESHNGEEQRSYFELGDHIFTGMTYLIDVNGTISMARYYEKGKAFSGISDKDNILQLPAPIAARRCDAKITARGCTSTNGCTPPTAGSGGCKNGGGRYEWGVIGHTFTDWYYDRNADGRGQPSEYYDTTRQEVRGYVWVPSGGSGPAPQNSWSYMGLDGNGHTRSIPKPSVQPKRVIKHSSLAAYPCVGKILGELAKGDFKSLRLNKLGQLEGGKNLSKTILDLFQKSANYHLNIKVGTLSNANGSTRIVRNSPSRGQITFDITLDKRFVKNGTRLVIARTLIHESLHAYLSYMYQNMPTASFPTLLGQYLSSNGYNNNAAQHRLMTEFTDAIGYSLRAWDNNKLSLQYYKDLGWSGDMLKTNEFKALSSSRQAAIRNANIAEGSAAQNASSKAKGIKCK